MDTARCELLEWLLLGIIKRESVVLNHFFTMKTSLKKCPSRKFTSCL